MTCTLIHGDCLEEMQKLIDEGTTVDLVLIDPPYNINKEKGWDNRKKEEYIEFMGEVFTKANTILKDNGTFIWFHSEMPLIAELMVWIGIICRHSVIIVLLYVIKEISVLYLGKTQQIRIIFVVGLILVNIFLFIPKAMNYIVVLIRRVGIECG